MTDDLTNTIAFIKKLRETECEYYKLVTRVTGSTDTRTTIIIAMDYNDASKEVHNIMNSIANVKLVEFSLIGTGKNVKVSRNFMSSILAPILSFVKGMK